MYGVHSLQGVELSPSVAFVSALSLPDTKTHRQTEKLTGRQTDMWAGS